jgi:hypothetical protein
VIKQRNNKSCHSDQYLADPQDSGPTVSPTDIAASVFFVRRWSMLANGCTVLRPSLDNNRLVGGSSPPNSTTQSYINGDFPVECE